MSSSFFRGRQLAPPPSKKLQFHNLDALRLFAAAAVIFSHGFLIAEGVEDNEPLQQATGEILGMYGVYVFFILSGFLITRSWQRQPDPASSFTGRLLRVYPAYVASVLLGVLLVAPLWYEGGILDYFASPGLRHAVEHGLAFDYNAYYVLGVRFYADEGNLGGVINGVYWSLQTEVLLYLVLAVLGALGVLRWYVALGLSLLTLMWHLKFWYVKISFGYDNTFDLWGFTFAAPGFFAGSFLYFWFQHHAPSARLALVLGLLAVTVPFLDLGAYLPANAQAHQLFPVLAAYPILWLGHGGAPSLGNWTRWGDLSYGLYLFGWPVQQVLRSLLGPDWSGWSFFVPSLAFSLAAACISWRLIEAPSLSLKRRMLERASRSGGGADTYETMVPPLATAVLTEVPVETN